MSRPVKHPFAALAVAEWFDVPRETVALQSLRVYASRRGAQLGRVFRVRDEPHAGVFRVERLPDSVARTSTFPPVEALSSPEFRLVFEGWVPRDWRA